MKERYEARFRLHEVEGKLIYMLDVFGDSLAKKQGYKSGLDGLDAIRYYLIQKHHWLPRDVNSMSPEEMRFALSEELAGWTVPKDARV